jgi:hypothetical protein
MTKAQRKLKKRLIELKEKWGAQNANKPTENEKNKFRKQLKKHLKDPVKFSRPNLLRGWWGE